MSDNQLPFPLPEDLQDPFANEIGARLRASYASVPPASSAQIERATRAVLSHSHHASTTAASAVRPRWWWGAAAAAVLVAVVIRPWRPDGTQRRADSAFVAGTASVLPFGSTNEEHGGTVRFEFTLPTDARQVALVGDFNGWDERATLMVQQRANGRWSARVPLEPGRHQYAFVVDGHHWVIDPLAPQVADGGFGPTNAVVVDGEAEQ